MLNFLRSLFSSDNPSTDSTVRISADAMRFNHTLRLINDRPSGTQLKTLLPGKGNKVLEFNEGNGDQYRFNLVDEGGQYRIDILDQPSYGSRAADGHSTHRLRRADGTQYVCIKQGYEPRDKSAAAGLAIDWARRTSRYIRNGRPWNS
jgi:hypothetical protein